MIERVPGRPSVRRFVERSLALVVVLLGAARLALLATSDLNRRTLVFAAPDDAFYYLQIAWNLSRGLGSTFDGIHPTNGYQPAWCLLLAAVAKCVSTRSALLDLSIAIGATFHLLAGLLVARAASRLFASFVAPLFLALWLLGPQLEDFLHLEAPLNSVALAAVLWCASLVSQSIATGRDARRSWMALGLAATLASLTRLDNAVLLPALAWWAWRGARGGGRRRAESVAWVLGMPGIALLAYAVVNQAVIGTALPVSGTLKAGKQLFDLRRAWETGGVRAVPGFVASVLERAIVSGPARFTSAWLDREPWSGSIVSLGVPCVLGVIGWWAVVRPGLARDEHARRLWAAVTAAVLCHTLFMLAMVGGFPREWHWMPEAVWLVIVASFAIPASIRALADLIPRAASPTRALASLALAAAMAAVSWDSLFAAYDGFAWGHLISNQQIASARHWNQVLPSGTRVGAWNAGYLAYFSDLQVVNLDGLVNSPDFARRIENDRWLDYCRETGIRYVADIWGGAFDVLARETPVVERYHPNSFIEYVLLAIPDRTG